MTEGIIHLTLSQQLSSVDGTKFTSAFHPILDLLSILWISLNLVIGFSLSILRLPVDDWLLCATPRVPIRIRSP